MDLNTQIKLFDEALNELTEISDLVNQVLEVTFEDDTIRLQRYELPKAN